MTVDLLHVSIMTQCLPDQDVLEKVLRALIACLRECLVVAKASTPSALPADGGSPAAALDVTIVVLRAIAASVYDRGAACSKVKLSFPSSSPCPFRSFALTSSCRTRGNSASQAVFDQLLLPPHGLLLAHLRPANLDLDTRRAALHCVRHLSARQSSLLLAMHAILEPATVDPEYHDT